MIKLISCTRIVDTWSNFNFPSTVSSSFQYANPWTFDVLFFRLLFYLFIAFTSHSQFTALKPICILQEMPTTAFLFYLPNRIWQEKTTWEVRSHGNVCNSCWKTRATCRKPRRPSSAIIWQLTTKITTNVSQLPWKIVKSHKIII